MARTPLSKQQPYAVSDADFVDVGLAGKGRDDGDDRIIGVQEFFLDQKVDHIGSGFLSNINGLNLTALWKNHHGLIAAPLNQIYK